MFGYVNINRSSITTEQGKDYQSYYCGLCQTLRKKYGTKGQILLNYDITFLIVLLTGLYEVENRHEDYVCPLHPTKKKNLTLNDITQYAADMNILLTYQNLMDDWEDNRDYTKKAYLKMLEKDYEEISARYPRQAAKLEEALSKLRAAEKDEESTMDVLAGFSGEMIEEIFVWDEKDVFADELRNLAFYLGKFVYIMDAYEDFEKDKKRGTFNPFKGMKFEDGQEFETIAKLMLTTMMSECAKSFERLPIILHADLLRNIIYSGVWCRYEFIQVKKNKTKGKNKKNDN